MILFTSIPYKSILNTYIRSLSYFIKSILAIPLLYYLANILIA